MRNNKEEIVYRFIEYLRYLSIYNLQPWLSNKAINLEASLQWPTKLIYSLFKKEKIVKARIYPEFGNYFRYNTLYCMPSVMREPISSTMLMHQIGLRDIMLAFIFLYPQYDVHIDEVVVYGKKVNKKNISYRPDLKIVLTDKTNPKKKYTFLIELERSRTNILIKKQKLDKIENFGNIEGFPEHGKILIIYAHHLYNIYNRPIQYDEPEIADDVRSCHNRLQGLLEEVKEYPKHKYLFMAFPDFYRLNEAVWYKPDGKKVKLIQ